jgi:plasmid stabilization system protein ParE
MALHIIISERAEKNLDAIIHYLSASFSEKVKMDFLAQLSEKVQAISQMPHMYRASKKKKGVRECVINKYTLLYYRVTPTTIEIITIQDTRSNPDALDL